MLLSQELQICSRPPSYPKNVFLCNITSIGCRWVQSLRRWSYRRAPARKEAGLIEDEALAANNSTRNISSDSGPIALSYIAHSLANFIKVSTTCSLSSSHYTEERNKDYVLAFRLQQQTITSARDKSTKGFASSLLHAPNEKTVYLPPHWHANYQTRPVPHADQVVPCMCCTAYSQVTCPLSNPDNLFGIGLLRSLRMVSAQSHWI